MNLQTFLSEALKNNGGSYNITTGESNPTDGYMVSLPNNELVIDANDLCATILSEYIINNAEELSSDKSFVGLWIDNGKAYLDVSVKYDDLETACYVGIINDQKAIYDNANAVAIHLPTPQRSGTMTQQRTYNRMAAEQTADAYSQNTN
jgi:hypothetical protein